jgi:DNA-directed RNA polymerase specialized sigma24 family protein
VESRGRRSTRPTRAGRQREVVGLRILLDQSIEETARILGLSPGTVKAHLNRALSKLRRGLAEAGIDARY